MVATSTCYRHVRAQIEDGDLLLFRRPGSLIADESDGSHSHSAMAVWRRPNAAPVSGGVLLLGESREWRGVRLVTLSSQVAGNPGVIDVYRPICEPRLKALAADYMVRQAGHAYGYAACWRYSLTRLGLLNRALLAMHLVDRPEEASEPRWMTPKFCSCQTEWCYRQAARELGLNFDPHPGLPSQFVTPSLQAHSPAFSLVFQGLTP